jgi:diguanylate cyclase (GGDEF)-like protein
MVRPPSDAPRAGSRQEPADRRPTISAELDRILSNAVPPPRGETGASRPAGDGEAPFFARVDDALRRAIDRGEPLGLLLVEVDGFAARFGQLPPQARDGLLERVTGSIEHVLSERDAYTRWRNERLVILLEGAGRGKTRAVGGRLRSLVEQGGHASSPEDWPITVTIGGACHPADGETLPELFRRAEEALGEARRLGRNRVWCYVRRPRVPVEAPVRLDGPGREWLGITRDISDSGLYLETDNDLPEGLRLALSIELPDMPSPIRCIGRVIRHSQAVGGNRNGLGVEFESYGQGARRLLDTFVGRALVEGRVDCPTLP